MHGGGKRTRAILDAIEAEQPDIVTLQEFRNGSNRHEMIDGLSVLGLKHQFIPETSSNRDNTVIVASKFPFEDSETKSFYATHLFQQLLRDGWIDAWRSRNAKAREFTWISTKQQNGFRYDHALVSLGFDSKISYIEYQHDVRLSGTSDHSMLLIEILV